MEKIYTNLLLNPIIFLRKILKKSKIDNFIGGLLIGAVVSLLVNYVTFQVQDQLQKQRILEAVENEILNNTVDANSLFKSNQQEMQKGSALNYFYTSPRYSETVWNSSNAISYVVQLPTDVQKKLFGYYFTLERQNDLIQKTEKLRETFDSKCTPFLNVNFSSSDNTFCISLNNDLLNLDNKIAYNIARVGHDTLNYFHPTKDRTNNPFLRFFLGSDALYVLTH